MIKFIIPIILILNINCDNNYNNPAYQQSNKYVPDLYRSTPDSAYTMTFDVFENRIDVGVINELPIYYFFIRFDNTDMINLNEVTYSDFLNDEYWELILQENDYSNYSIIHIIPEMFAPPDSTVIPIGFNDVIFSLHFEWKDNLTINNPNIEFTDLWIISDIYSDDDEYYQDLDYEVFKNNYQY